MQYDIDLYSFIPSTLSVLCVCFTDDFVPTRQRRFYNNSSSISSSQAKGNALEIARQFRLQKQKTTTKPSAVSKVVKSAATDIPIVKPGMSAMTKCVCLSVCL